MNDFRQKNCSTKARKLEQGEKHVLCGNFIGPGTLIDKYSNIEPYNNIDGCAKIHDLAYNKSFKIKDKEERMKAIRKDDDEFLKCIEKFKDLKEEKSYYDAGKYGITGKIFLEKNAPEISKKILGEEYMGGRKIKKK